MNTPLISSTPQERHEQFPQQEDAFLSQVDDEALEHALKTVGWHPKDVSQFLRSASLR
jgi:hypothetical protein